MHKKDINMTNKKQVMGIAQEMIESYALVLDSTARMFRNSDARGLKDEEIAKRADMFWGMTMQEIDRKNQQNQMMMEVRDVVKHQHVSG